jgi:hypothetical protein
MMKIVGSIQGGHMKKIVLVLLAMVLFVTPAIAVDKTLNFFWTQTLPSPNDLAGWGLYQSPTAGGPYIKILDIPYTSQQVEYATTKIITVPDGQFTTLYFVLDAVDGSGNRSGKSNEAVAVIDLRDSTPPAIPIQLRITIINLP